MEIMTAQFEPSRYLSIKLFAHVFSVPIFFHASNVSVMMFVADPEIEAET